MCIVQRSLPILDKDIEVQINKQPEKRTVILNVSLNDPPKIISYNVTSNLPAKRTEGKDPSSVNVVIVDSFKYVKKHYIDFSVGLSYLFDAYNTTAPDAINNNLPKVSEGDRFKPTVGLHYYPFGLIKVDNYVFRRMKHHFSFYAGLSFKNALDNLYLGASWDIVPGIRLIGGQHFYKDTRYLINNNAVIDQASSFKSSGFFMSINLEPKAFASIIGLIK